LGITEEKVDSVDSVVKKMAEPSPNKDIDFSKLKEVLENE